MVETGEVSVAPPKFNDQLPEEGDVSCELEPNVNVLPFAATVSVFVLVASNVPVITGAAFVVTVCELTVGVPSVGLLGGVGLPVLLTVAWRYVGVTLNVAASVASLTVVSFRGFPTTVTVLWNWFDPLSELFKLTTPLCPMRTETAPVYVESVLFSVLFLFDWLSRKLPVMVD